MDTGTVTVFNARPGVDFVETDYIKGLAARALEYLRAGFPVNFSGPTGVGKTTVAMHIAGKLGRPVVLICGDHEFNGSDLVGGLQGYRMRSIRDNFIRSVLKTDETMSSQWSDNRLTIACEYGLTLVYDEFTRSRPEANNVLLSVLEEGILPVPRARGGEGYIKVHPDFKALLTSNPEEYAGVYRSQDALRDRMVTVELGNFDEETEIAITRAKAGITAEEAARIVGLVRRVREVKSNPLTPTIRACIMMAKVLKLRSASAGPRSACLDILMPEVSPDERERVAGIIESEFAVFA